METVVQLANGLFVGHGWFVTSMATKQLCGEVFRVQGNIVVREFAKLHLLAGWEHLVHPLYVFS